VCMLYEDIPVAMSLMGEKNPYPFGNTDFQVIFAYRGMSVTMGDEMPPVETEPVQPEEPKDCISYFHNDSRREIYKDPLDSVTAMIENLVGISGGLSAEVVSITYDEEATQERIDSILKNGLKSHSREYMEENFRVYQVVFDLETMEDYPVKPLPSGRYSRKLQMLREDPWPEYWQLYMLDTPQYLGETPEETEPTETTPPEETEPTETTPPADTAALPPIVIQHSMLTYESGSTPEEAARSVVENLDDSIRILSVAYSEQLTQLNLLLPVDVHRIAAYRYTTEFMEEHFKVVNVSCTYNGNEMLYTLKTVQNPDTGIWEIWDFHAQEVK